MCVLNPKDIASICLECGRVVCLECEPCRGSSHTARDRAKQRNQTIADLYYTGYAKQDIAKMLFCTVRTVEMKIKKIHDAKKGSGGG